MKFSNRIHAEIDAWLAAAEGEGLTAAERAALADHLQACPACRHIEEEHHAMSQLLKESLEEKKPAPGFEERLVAGFRHAREENPAPVPSPLARFLEALRGLLYVRTFQYSGALAGLIALVMVGAWVTREPLGKPSPKMFISSAAPNSPGSMGRTARARVGSVRTDSSSLPSGSDILAPEPAAAPAQMNVSTSAARFGAIKMMTKGWGKDAPTSTASEQAAAPVTDSSDANGMISTFGAVQVTAQKQKDAPARMFAAMDHPATASAPIPASMASLEAAPSARTAPIPLPSTGKIIRNAFLQFEVAKFDDAVGAVTAAARAEGGFVDTQNSAQGANGKISGTVVVKVLPDHLDAFLARIAGIGTLRNQRIEAQDITKAYADTDARMRNAQKMEARLIDMLDTKSGKVSDLLQVEKELGRVRSEIEQMQAELKMYDGQLAYATATITLSEKDLDQAAAFVVKGTAELSLLSSDVEKTFHAASEAVGAAQGQVEETRLSRDAAGRMQGTLRFLVAPEEADALLETIRGLGRVAHFTREDRRIAQGGSTPSEDAAVRREQVEIILAFGHDEEVRQTVTLRVIAKDIAAQLAQAKAAALARSGEILDSDLQEQAHGGATAKISVRVPAEGFAALQDDFKGLGRVDSLQSQRRDGSTPSPDADRAPVLLNLMLTNEETPSSIVVVSVLTRDVEARAAELKKTALAAGAEVRDSTFERTADARTTAHLLFRLPPEHARDLLARVRQAGKVESFSESRRDRPEEGVVGEAPAEIAVTLDDPGAAIADANGLGATLRRTLGQGAAALTWSLRMIGVAVAFLAPWLVLAALGAGGFLLARRWKKKKKKKG